MDEIVKLREQARFCRAQAEMSVLPGAADAFEQMAKRFDADADALEKMQSKTLPHPILRT